MGSYLQQSKHQRAESTTYAKLIYGNSTEAAERRAKRAAEADEVQRRLRREFYERRAAA